MATVSMQVKIAEKEYDAFRLAAAQLGMEAGDLISAFVNAIVREDPGLKQWQQGQKKKNFMSYLADKEKFLFVARLVNRIELYSKDLSYNVSAGDKEGTREMLSKLEACWSLIQEEFEGYRDEDPLAKPLWEEPQAIRREGACNDKTDV